MAVVLKKITRVGNSFGITLPKDELDRLQLGLGDMLSITKSENGLVLSPYDEDFSRRVSAFERSRRKFRNAYRELAK